MQLNETRRNEMNQLYDNWKRKKPEGWTEYQWELLRTLDSMSYQAKRLADAFDSVDTHTSSERLNAIVNDALRQFIKIAETNAGYYANYQERQYTGHYNEPTNPDKY